MNRVAKFTDTIDRLENIITNNLPGNIIAEQIEFGLRYCIDVERGISKDISLLKNLCASGLPFKDIEVFDERTLNSVYISFGDMKSLLKERK